MKKAMIFFCGLLLLMTATTGFGQVLYEEHFDNGVMNLEWRAGFGGESDSMQVDYDDDQEWIGKITGADAMVAGLTYAGTSDMADYTFEALVYCTVNQSMRNGIIFRYDENMLQYYDFIAQFYSGMAGPAKLRLRYYNSTTNPPEIYAWDNSTLPGGIPTADGWHHMKIMIAGNQVWAYWDNQLLPGCPITDSTYDILPSGQFGVYTFSTAGGGITKCDDIVVTTNTIGIEDAPASLPATSYLLQNAPNPFTGATVLSFNLAQPGVVQLKVFNSAGQLLDTPLQAGFGVGVHEFAYRPENDIPSGTYFYQLEVDNKPLDQKRMILVR